MSHFADMLAMLQAMGVPWESVVEDAADTSPPSDQLTAEATATDDLATASTPAGAEHSSADLHGSEVEGLDTSATAAAAVAAAAAAAAAAATDDNAVKVGVVVRKGTTAEALVVWRLLILRMWMRHWQSATSLHVVLNIA
jgi:ribosomal protein S11